MKLVPIAVIGKGNVGKAFLRQVAEARPRFRERGLDLRVTAVVGKSAGLYVQGGIPDATIEDLANGRAKIEKTRTGDGPAGGWDEVTANIAAAGALGQVVVDATAEDDARVHAEWLKRGWNVVTANKRPITGPLLHYDAILAGRDRPEAPGYRYEATVGAGLPIISTLQDMLATGDEVIEVRAAVSGTLGFLFSSCEEGVPFSAAVAEAKSRGYTEPDPREDLSGADVARKALILARLFGQRKELKDIPAESLVPPELEGATVEEFLRELGGHSRAIDDRFRAVARRKHTLRYLMAVTPSDVRVGIEEVPVGTAFGARKGPENMFIIRTRRYNALPLVIRGPGAGAEVTAAGIFADVLRIIRH
ncbi:MAG TPA: homoserine dehydrogenase [Candidatus Binatia bacterium]|jgi:homoserine dehydrogenase|nr:homoserine dehydrogenase [Candidatus Binatia bacterium]